MKKYILIAISLILGCSQDNTKDPGEVLDKSEMARVMTEVHILEAKIYKLYLKDDSATKLFQHYESLLLDSLDISREQYENSMKYYFADPKKFEKVYNVVVDTLLNKEKTSTTK